MLQLSLYAAGGGGGAERNQFLAEEELGGPLSFRELE
jgi:hypothetical protein